MFGVFVLIVIIIYYYYSTTFIKGTKKRMVARIKKDAIAKGYQVLYIRKRTRFDGDTPFSKLNIPKTNTTITLNGTSGEKTFYRIVTVKNKEGEELMFWVRVDTVFFKPSAIRWVKFE